MYTSPHAVRLLPEIAQALSGVLFIAYGISCFASTWMIAEFDRYRMASMRVQTGVLQILGGAGVLVGHFYRPLLIFSAAGLALMMFLALITRYQIRDPLRAALPAFSLFCLNAYIVAAAVWWR